MGSRAHLKSTRRYAHGLPVVQRDQIWPWPEFDWHIFPGIFDLGKIWTGIFDLGKIWTGIFDLGKSWPWKIWPWKIWPWKIWPWEIWTWIFSSWIFWTWPWKFEHVKKPISTGKLRYGNFDMKNYGIFLNILNLWTFLIMCQLKNIFVLDITCHIYVTVEYIS